jgi:hypothetical protein
MPPAWRSALSPAGLGESGGVLCNRWAVTRTVRGVLASSVLGSSHDAWDPAPVSQGGTLERVGEDSVRDG